MPRYALQAPNATVHIDATLTAHSAKGTQVFQHQNDIMLEIGYRGATVGFCGFGIDFNVRGMIFGNSSGNIKVEIGFLQSMTATVADGGYQGAVPPMRYLRRFQPVLPVRDGSRSEIWYKPDDAKVEYTAQQMTALSRFGGMQGLAFRMKAGDQVKSSFPPQFTFDKQTLPLANFNLTRDFITCVVVRVTTPPPAETQHLFFLDRVTWRASYVAALTSGNWNPDPASVNFYTVGAVQPGVAPYTIIPTGISLGSNVANSSEIVELVK